MNKEIPGKLKSSSLRKKLLRIYLVIGIMSVVIVGSMGYSYHKCNRMVAVNSQLIDAANEIKVNVTMGHLWLEEIISGDRYESIEDVLGHLDKADRYAQVILGNEINGAGEYISLRDPQMRQEIAGVRSKLVDFRKITLERWNSKATSGVGSEIDQKYDEVFRDLFEQANTVEIHLQQLVKRDFRNFRIVQTVLICTCLFIAVVVGVVLSRFTYEQIQQEIKLRGANQQLDASNQQLLASEQQLKAANQQLNAGNQQLLASEQQLKAANQQLNASNQQLNAANQQRERLMRTLKLKNDELQSVVYISSHDLRTPLVNIKGFSDLLVQHCEAMEKLIEKGVTDEDVKKEILSLIKDDISEDLEYICTSTDRMEQLIEGLLRVSRIGTSELDFKTVDMDNLISGIIDTLKYRTQDVEAEIVFDRLPDCTGDEDQITQVFTNLIDNALKYLDPNQKGAIRLTVETKEDRHIYCVEDNGIGINEAYHDKIFEIYHRLDPKSSAKGEGLGLTIVQRIIDRHNGDIWLESEPGKGSKFYVSLPIGG